MRFRYSRGEMGVHVDTLARSRVQGHQYDSTPTRLLLRSSIMGNMHGHRGKHATRTEHSRWR